MSLLDDLIDQVLASSELSAKQKEDAEKVLHCLQYVRDNLSIIQYAVDNPHDPGVYRFPEDQARKVLRDDCGTSFHMEYKNGEQAVRDLTAFIGQIENILQELASDRWMEFAKRLEYSREKGCMEERMRGAVAWARCVISTTLPNLHDIMRACVGLRGNSQKSLLSIAKQYCQEKKYTVCLYKNTSTVALPAIATTGAALKAHLGAKSDLEETPITEALLREYITDILGEDIEEEKEEKQPHPSFQPLTPLEQYLALCVDMHEQVGRQGMIWHCFKKKEEAEKFRAWLIQQTNLKSLAIHKSSVTQEVVDQKTVYVVRLTKEQKEALWPAADRTLFEVSGPNAETALAKAAREAKAEDFIALVNNHSQVAVDRALVVQGLDGKTALHVAARHRGEAGFSALIEKASPRALGEAFVKADKDGRTHFHCNWIIERGLLALIAKVPLHALREAFVKQDSDGWTALHWVARYQSETAFLALLANVSPHALDEALDKLGTGLHGWTALALVARYQSETAFLALLAKVSPHALDAALDKQDKTVWAALKTAAYYQSEKCFIALMQAVSPAALVRALAADLDDNLLTIFWNQSPAAVLAFFQRLDSKELAKTVSLKAVATHVVKKTVTYLLYEKTWQDQKVIENCFTLFDKALTTLLLERWKEGALLPNALQKQMAESLRRRDPSALTRLEKDWLQFYEDGLNKRPLELCLGGGIKPLSEELVHEHKSLIAQLVYESGVTSWKDYHLLRAIPSDEVPLLKEVLDALMGADLVFTGAKVQVRSLPEIPSKDPRFERLMQCIAEDRALFKMIQPKDWDEFFSQFSDYTTRPTTLRKPDVKNNATHKFKHMTGQVEEYKPKVSPQAQPQRTHTKKLSTTLMARNLATAVFGETHSDRELVGMFFDRDKCRIKALLAQDCGTYNHEWIGSKSAAQEYARRVQSFNYTQMDKFIERVNVNPYRTSEVLAELSRDGALGIVIASDTPAARKIARERHKAIKDRFGIDLVVVFYNNVKRTIELYAPTQMMKDEQGVQDIKEEIARDKLMKLKAKISIKNDWRVFSFSSLFSYFKPSVSLDLNVEEPKTIKSILEKINKASQKRHTYSWEKAESEIKAELEGVNTTPSFFRYKETSGFYQAVYSEHFSPAKKILA